MPSKSCATVTADLAAVREATRLGCDLYGALARHGLLKTYREHGGIVGAAYADPSMPICALVPQSLGALVRVTRDVSVSPVHSFPPCGRWVAFGRGQSATDDTPEIAVARALLLALGGEA